MRQLVASVRTPDPVSVAFAVRRAGRTWARVAADDAPPYRAFLDPSRFRRGEAVEAIAIANATDGSISRSAIQRLVPRPR